MVNNRVNPEDIGVAPLVHSYCIGFENFFNEPLWAKQRENSQTGVVHQVVSDEKLTQYDSEIAGSEVHRNASTQILTLA